MTHHLTKWTAELDEKLLTLWREGLSALQVGQKLGVTRNAIVGRLHRLGEPKRDPALLPHMRGRAKADSARKGWRSRRLLAVRFDLHPDNNPHAECNVSLFDARPGQCREIVGTDVGVATFCGAPTVLHSCCHYHASINYMAPRYWTDGPKKIEIADLSVAQKIQINDRRAVA